MPTFQQFPLPDAGEGLTEAEIVAWHVAVGDTVAVNQTIVEIETAKSLVDLPSPWAGVVTKILVEPGQTVDVGTPIIEVDTDPSGAPAPEPAAPTVPVAQSGGAIEHGHRSSSGGNRQGAATSISADVADPPDHYHGIATEAARNATQSHENRPPFQAINFIIRAG